MAIAPTDVLAPYRKIDCKPDCWCYTGITEVYGQGEVHREDWREMLKAGIPVFHWLCPGCKAHLVSTFNATDVADQVCTDCDDEMHFDSNSAEAIEAHARKQQRRT
jgi:hypothetical protein